MVSEEAHLRREAREKDLDIMHERLSSMSEQIQVLRLRINELEHRIRVLESQPEQNPKR